MKMLILGGGGMLGQKITSELAKVGKVGELNISHLHLVDAYNAPATSHRARFQIISEISDLTGVGTAQALSLLLRSRFMVGPIQR